MFCIYIILLDLNVRLQFKSIAGDMSDEDLSPVQEPLYQNQMDDPRVQEIDRLFSLGIYDITM